MFNNKLLTADPKPHLLRAKILLDKENDSYLLYAALEMRLAIERIVHNQLTISIHHSKKDKKKNDPKRKKLLMGIIDPESDNSYDIFFLIRLKESKHIGAPIRISQSKKIKEIEGKLGNLLHMKLGLNLGIADDPWYADTRRFLETTCSYLTERVTDSMYYFSFEGMDNFELIKK